MGGAGVLSSHRVTGLSTGGPGHDAAVRPAPNGSVAAPPVGGQLKQPRRRHRTSSWTSSVVTGRLTASVAPTRTFATSLHRAQVAQQVILPCEAFDNFPPGLPGTMVTLAARLAGLPLAARQPRVSWLRRLRLLFGQMARRPLQDDLVRRWTEPLQHDPDIRRELRKDCRGSLPKETLVRDTEALRPAWLNCCPRGKYAEVPDEYVLSMLDQPEAVARAIGDFLLASTGRQPKFDSDRRTPANRGSVC